MPSTGQESEECRVTAKYCKKGGMGLRNDAGQTKSCYKVDSVNIHQCWHRIKPKDSIVFIPACVLRWHGVYLFAHLLALGPVQGIVRGDTDACGGCPSIWIQMSLRDCNVLMQQFRSADTSHGLSLTANCQFPASTAWRWWWDFASSVCAF